MLQHEAPAALPFSKADESLRYERGGVIRGWRSLLCPCSGEHRSVVIDLFPIFSVSLLQGGSVYGIMDVRSN